MYINISKPYVISWVFMPIFMLIGILSSGMTIDVQLHDTYYVFENWNLALVSSGFMALIGVGYWMILKANGKISRQLTAIHLALTIGFFLLMLFAAIVFNTAEDNPSKKFGYDLWRLVADSLLMSIVCFVLSQLFYLLNLIIGLIRR